jgi:hypothetical protein
MGLPSKNLTKEVIDFFAQHQIKVKTTVDAIENLKVSELV